MIEGEPAQCSKLNCPFRKVPLASRNSSRLASAELTKIARVRWLSIINAVFILTAVGFITVIALKAEITAHILSTQQTAELYADCRWWQDIATSPIVVNPPLTHPSFFSIKTIDDARIVFTAQKCPGTLIPPSAGLKKWTSFYRLPAPVQ